MLGPNTEHFATPLFDEMLEALKSLAEGGDLTPDGDCHFCGATESNVAGECVSASCPAVKARTLIAKVERKAS
jgi:hypothetical protein